MMLNKNLLSGLSENTLLSFYLSRNLIDLSFTLRQRIACLSLSMTQSTLLVGTGSSEVLLYDVASHQLVRSFAPLKDKGQGLGITYIRCLLKPPDLVGNISLGFNVSSMTSAKDIIPTRPVMPFQRVRDGKTRGLHEVSIMIPPSNEVRQVTVVPFVALNVL